MKKKLKVYLCGGINKLSDAECKDWRAEATEALSPYYDILDPMRRDYRGREMELGCMEEIIQNDLRDIIDSDFVLVNATRPSWGTAMELVYARMFGKGVIAFLDCDVTSPWLRYHTTIRTPSLLAALRLLLANVSIAKGLGVGDEN